MITFNHEGGSSLEVIGTTAELSEAALDNMPDLRKDEGEISDLTFAIITLKWATQMDLTKAVMSMVIQSLHPEVRRPSHIAELMVNNIPKDERFMITKAIVTDVSSKDEDSKLNELINMVEGVTGMRL